MGGSTFSAAQIASGLSKRNYHTSFVATRPLPGKLPVSLEQDGLNICTPCKGIHQFRQRLKSTYKFLSNFDVVINNHSTETRLVIPSLPEQIIRIATIRSVAPRFVILNAVNISKYTDALVGISPVVCSSLRDAGAETEVTLISNSVNVSSNDLPQYCDICHLLFVGRMENKAKNVKILPWIIADLKDRGVNVFLNIIGDGADMNLLQTEIRKSGCSDIIAIHGALSRFETVEYLSRSNFILVPSYYEGFGRVVAEGMAAGCVPIASDIEVFKWLLGEAASTLQCSRDESAEYAGAIANLLDNKVLYKNIQSYLRYRQKSEFSPENTLDGYTNLIEEIKTKRSRHIETSRGIGNTLPPCHRIRYSLLYAVLSTLWAKFKKQ